MLTSILPGLRDLRTPLATGYLWLAASLVIFANWIPNRETESVVIARAFELGGAVGTTALLGATSFVAYLLGSALCAENIDIERRYESMTKVPLLGKLVKEPALSRQTLLQYNELINSTFQQVVRNHDLTTMLQSVPMSRHLFDTEGQGDPQFVFDAMKRRVTGERSIIENRLHNDKLALWDDYDRENAEGQFRLSVCWPMTVLAIAIYVRIVIEVGWSPGLILATIGLLVAMGLIAAIAARGIQRFAKALEIIIVSICIEPDRSPYLNQLRSMRRTQQSI